MTNPPPWREPQPEEPVGLPLDDSDPRGTWDEEIGAWLPQVPSPRPSPIEPPIGSPAEASGHPVGPVPGLPSLPGYPPPPYPVLPPPGSLPADLTSAAQPPAAPPATPVEREPLAVAALVTGLLGFVTIVTGPIAVVLGIAALVLIRRSGAPGRGLAIAGIVAGALAAASFVVAILAVSPGGAR